MNGWRRVSGCLSRRRSQRGVKGGEEGEGGEDEGGGSKPPDGDQQRGKVAKFSLSPFPIGLHYLRQNKGFLLA